MAITTGDGVDLETEASSILQFIHGLRGELQVTWEEGTWAAWLYDMLQPQVDRVLVCDPRRNALLKEGNKSDKIDARKLADLLRTGMLRPVYHGEHGLRTLRELGRSYRTISQDLNRVMNRIKALYRGWSIPSVQAPRSMLCVTARNGYTRLNMPGCAGGPSCCISSWMDCRRYGEPYVLSYWRKAGNTKPRNCCARFPASVRSGLPA